MPRTDDDIRYLKTGVGSMATTVARFTRMLSGLRT